MMRRPKNLPKNAGVYIFRNKAEQIIYIGKAKSIAKRIASYCEVWARKRRAIDSSSQSHRKRWRSR